MLDCFDKITIFITNHRSKARDPSSVIDGGINVTFNQASRRRRPNGSSWKWSQRQPFEPAIGAPRGCPILHETGSKRNNLLRRHKRSFPDSRVTKIPKAPKRDGHLLQSVNIRTQQQTTKPVKQGGSGHQYSPKTRPKQQTDTQETHDRSLDQSPQRTQSTRTAEPFSANRHQTGKKFRRQRHIKSLTLGARDEFHNLSHSPSTCCEQQVYSYNSAYKYLDDQNVIFIDRAQKRNLRASQGKDIIVWQQPDLRQFTKFGQGDGSVKALVAVGNKVFTAHQDSKIRVWKVSTSSENVFKLINTLPTTKDYLGKFMKQSNYVQTRRHHKRLWIEHADSISCLAVYNGLVYSGSWDKTLKVWRISDLKCLESIKAHDDAINSLVACKGIVYSASADGKIKAWGKHGNTSHSLQGILEGHKDVSLNSVTVSEDGKWVYGGGSDGYIMGWEGNANFISWKLVSETKAHHMAVLCMCLMGEVLCSGSADKTIGIWKREAYGKLCKIGVINGHQGPIKCLQASPCNVGNGFLLYSGGLDKTVRVWWVPKRFAI
ncbi:hypothetical protein GOBAR_DD24024 [Gossypium barbadense]|nr:hypothetical protein GOBAR_DD24024 [Gossypium barbadense]